MSALNAAGADGLGFGVQGVGCWIVGCGVNGLWFWVVGVGFGV